MQASRNGSPVRFSTAGVPRKSSRNSGRKTGGPTCTGSKRHT